MYDYEQKYSKQEIKDILQRNTNTLHPGVISHVPEDYILHCFENCSNYRVRGAVDTFYEILIKNVYATIVLMPTFLYLLLFSICPFFNFSYGEILGCCILGCIILNILNYFKISIIRSFINTVLVGFGSIFFNNLVILVTLVTISIITKMYFLFPLYLVMQFLISSIINIPIYKLTLFVTSNKKRPGISTTDYIILNQIKSIIGTNQSISKYIDELIDYIIYIYVEKY